MEIEEGDIAYLGDRPGVALNVDTRNLKIELRMQDDGEIVTLPVQVLVHEYDYTMFHN